MIVCSMDYKMILKVGVYDMYVNPLSSAKSLVVNLIK